MVESHESTDKDDGHAQERDTGTAYEEQHSDEELLYVLLAHDEFSLTHDSLAEDYDKGMHLGHLALNHVLKLEQKLFHGTFHSTQLDLKLRPANFAYLAQNKL